MLELAARPLVQRVNVSPRREARVGHDEAGEVGEWGCRGGWDRRYGDTGQVEGFEAER